MSGFASEVVRILAVEDDPEEADLTRRFLEKRIDARVEITFDAAEVLPRLAAKSLEVDAAGYVIQDKNLPYTLVAAIENAMMKRSLKRVEEWFNMQQAITEAALNTLNEIFFAVDMRGTFIKWNKELSAATGYDDDEFCRMRLCDIMEPGDRERIKEQILGTGSEKTSVFDMTVVPRLGMKRVYEINARVFEASDGGTSGVSFLGHDVSESRHESEQLMRENEELDDFAQTVSHDLKRPLSAIMLAAETLRLILSTPCAPGTERPIDVVNEMTKIISDECTMASTMISSMLQLAEEGQVPVAIGPVDLCEVVDGVVEELRDASALEQLDVRVDADLGYVCADETHMYRLFANLIGNAVQHGSADTSPPVVEVMRVSVPEGFRGFLVRDHGRGIPEKLLPYIFRPFFKGSGEGTGIGLTTARKIVKIYGGDIRAYNDNGACFEFTLKD
jgi:PAS domain S-box-containing protein